MPWRLSARGLTGDDRPPAAPRGAARRVPDLFRQDSWRVRLLLAWLAWIVLGILLAAGMAPDRLVLEPGQVAPEDVAAPRSLIDRPATEQLRRQAAAQVQPSYVRNPDVVGLALRDVAAAFEQVRAVRGRADMLDERSRLASLRQALPLDLGDAAYEAVLAVQDGVLAAMERDVADVVRREMARNITEADLETFRKEAVAEVRALSYPRPLADFMAKVTERAVRPNFFVDPSRTRRQLEAVMNAVPPVTIVPGEIIVRKGQRVTADDLVRLRDAGVLGRPGDWRVTVGAFLLAGLLVAAAAVFLFLFRPALFASTSRLLLLAVIGVGAALLARVLWPISPYLAPVGGAAMLLTILLDPMAAVLAVVLLGVLTGLLTGGSLAATCVAVAGGLAGVLGVARAEQRSDIMRAGFLVALADVAAVAGLQLAFSAQGFEVADLGRSMLAGAANGVLLAGVLTLGSLPYFENAFGVLTSLRLLELSNPNQPLLRRLLLEAPGTYHHSLLVANLAEAGAEAVGANGLLARVGAYYHDVGKIKRPEFFVENQSGGHNPHDKLSPHLSALIVTAHVKEGIELARRYRLPEEILRFIPEHHGTCLISYFYQRAAAASDGEVDQAGFRHVGPVPQSRETAIVMLADAAEAAVRSLSRPTPGRVQAVVRRVIKARLEDRQLDQCDLTLRDLDKIAEAFFQVLSGVFHARVEYPASDPAQRGAAERQPAALPPPSGGEETAAAPGPAGVERADSAQGAAAGRGDREASGPEDGAAPGTGDGRAANEAGGTYPGAAEAADAPVRAVASGTGAIPGRARRGGRSADGGTVQRKRGA